MTDYELLFFLFCLFIFPLRVQAGYKTLGLIRRQICDRTRLFRIMVLLESPREDLC